MGLKLTTLRSEVSRSTQGTSQAPVVFAPLGLAYFIWHIVLHVHPCATYCSISFLCKAE